MTLHSYFADLLTLPQILELLLRIVIGGLCGILIGTERTKRLKEAGIRTHFLVACSSAAIMIVSKYGFADLALALYPGAKDADAARLAAQVVSGIGFLGAGMIFRGDSKISGLTTAAGLWATAGIGLTVGAGLYTVGIFCTLLILLVQWLTHQHAFKKDTLVTRVLTVTTDGQGHYQDELLEFLHENGIQGKATLIQKNENGTFIYGFRLQSAKRETVLPLLELLDGEPRVKTYELHTLE